MDSNVWDYNSSIQFVDKLLHQNDVKGAMNFAKRMQNSFPKLKGLLRFLDNIVVQVSSQDEETDWYTVLGVDPSADPKTMKKHYVRLAQILRPVGSREAHRLLNKAWEMLSNKVTRKDYDLRRRSREMQKNTLAVKQASSPNENVSQALLNVDNAVVSNQKSSNYNCNIGGSNQRDDFADQREISAMNWESIWNPEALYTILTACPSCHYESLRVCLISKADCLQCGKAFAALDVPSPDAKHKEGMSLDRDTGNSSKKNRKKRLSVGERNILAKKARDVIFNQLYERNSAAINHNERKAAATEGPEEDGLETMEVPGSDYHDFHGIARESLAEDQLNAVYAEIMHHFNYLLDEDSEEEAI